MQATSYVLGVDTGGTFTDFVLIGPEGERVHKLPSTPEAPERAIFQGLQALGLDQALAAGQVLIVHGTTVATNAALEGKGARTLFITNEGLEDVLLIGRQTRADLYDLTPAVPPQPLSRDQILGVSARLDAHGQELAPLAPEQLAALRDRIRAAAPEAIAISLLFSYLNPIHERQLRQALDDCGAFLTLSSEVLPLSGEYERGLATWLNAWLGPRMHQYLTRLQERAGASPVSIMQSSGHTLSARHAREQAVHLLLSGPAGGLSAARTLGRALDMPRLLTFDMGGTSTDVALCEGDFRLTLEGRIGPWPVAVPMVDLHTLGAGGGSLARVDAAGMLHVGPESAGADPGPACYGRGGTEATVTDAHVVLGHLPASARLGGDLPLDTRAARTALERLGAALGTDAVTAARGVLAVANEHMAQALRVISVQKGHDPRDFTLMCFGGAGGLHVCALADMLGMRRAVMPRHSGVLSAQGLVTAPRGRERVRSLPPLDEFEPVKQQVRLLAQDARQQLQEEEHLQPEQVRVQAFVDMCYRGQSFPLSIDWVEDRNELETRFHQEHQRRYGHRLQAPVAWINVRVRVSASESVLPPPHCQVDPNARGGVELLTDGRQVVVVPRQGLTPGTDYSGPMIVTDDVATLWVEDGWRVRRLPADHLVLTRMAGEERETHSTD